MLLVGMTYVAELKPSIRVCSPCNLIRQYILGHPAAPRLSERDAGHFDVYVGELFEEVSAEQARFFAEALQASAPVLEPAGALPLL